MMLLCIIHPSVWKSLTLCDNIIGQMMQFGEQNYIILPGSARMRVAVRKEEIAKKVIRYTLALSESLAAIILYKAIKRNHIRMEKRIFGVSQTSAKCCDA